MSDLTEAHERALSLIEDPLEAVYLDVTCRSFRNHEIELIETMMGDDAHSVTIYVGDTEKYGGTVRAYSWEEEKGKLTVKHDPAGLQLALRIMRKMMVMEDLSDV